MKRIKIPITEGHRVMLAGAINESIRCGDLRISSFGPRPALAFDDYEGAQAFLNRLAAVKLSRLGMTEARIALRERINGAVVAALKA